VLCSLIAGWGSAGPLASPSVLGYDGAGIVEAVGPEATLFKVGDRVYAAGDLNRFGTNGELFAVDERIVGHAPKSLSLTQASAVPLVLLTAWEGLFESLELTAFDISLTGKRILVLPGAGGVGSFVIQLVSPRKRQSDHCRSRKGPCTVAPCHRVAGGNRAPTPT
jgi:NADPH2:quinone reductase